MTSVAVIPATAATALDALANQAPSAAGPTHTMAVEQQRAIAETQAAMYVAKSFPRDLPTVLRRLKDTCSRRSVAEVATYSFTRGGEDISGPSVYLLKTIAQEFGNLTFGVRELSRTPGVMGAPGVSTVEAFAWDMERNVREVRNFEVRHWRDTRKGGYAIRDERDIYELIANMGSRRVRACLEGVIPADVVEYASQQCAKALSDANVDTPEFRAELLAGYAEFGVTQDRIEARLNKAFDAATANQLIRLQRGLTALRDGVTSADEAFPVVAVEAAETDAPSDKPSLKDRLAARRAAKPEPAADPAPAQAEDAS